MDLELLLALESDDETLEEVFLIQNESGQRRPSACPSFRFNPDDIDDGQFEQLFRFHRQDVDMLCNALCLIQPIQCGKRLVVHAKEALLILLRRLAYPNRLSDLTRLFGRSVPALSLICNSTAKKIVANKGHVLNLLSHQWLDHYKLQEYADAVVRRGAPLKNCWGFIDGTARAVCRPSINQEEYFSGHKRFHCVKYQSVVTPDGLILSLSKAYPGRKHDAGIFADSNLYRELEQKVAPYVLYGDPAYPMRDLLLAPYPATRLTQAKSAFNKRMSSVRQAVEWSFGKTISLFAFLDYSKNQKLLLQEIQNMYHVAVLLTNCHTCLHGSQASQYFELAPPNLEVYLGVL